MEDLTDLKKALVGVMCMLCSYFITLQKLSPKDFSKWFDLVKLGRGDPIQALLQFWHYFAYPQRL